MPTLLCGFMTVFLGSWIVCITGIPSGKLGSPQAGPDLIKTPNQYLTVVSLDELETHSGATLAMLKSSGSSPGGIGGRQWWSGEVAKGRLKAATDSLETGPHPQLACRGLTRGRGHPWWSLWFLPGCWRRLWTATGRIEEMVRWRSRWRTTMMWMEKERWHQRWQPSPSAA
jgi:hypothetical protein